MFAAINKAFLGSEGLIGGKELSKAVDKCI